MIFEPVFNNHGWRRQPGPDICLKLEVEGIVSERIGSCVKMNSSVKQFLPWRSESGHKRGVTQTSKVAVNNLKENFSTPSHNKKPPLTMPPLLRLNSEGEICTGTGLHFCDNMGKHRLSHSASFDSNTGIHSSTHSIKSPENHIPFHQSFKRSLSLNPIRMPAQPFPPPSSPMKASAIGKRSMYSWAENLSPYSGSPRVFGSSPVFETGNPRSTISILPLHQFHTKCARSHLSNCNENSSDDNNMKPEQIQEDLSKVTCQKSVTCQENQFMVRGKEDCIPHHSADEDRPIKQCVSDFLQKESSPKMPVSKTRMKRPSRGRRRRRQKKSCSSFAPASSSSPFEERPAMKSGLNAMEKCDKSRSTKQKSQSSKPELAKSVTTEPVVDLLSCNMNMLCQPKLDSHCSLDEDFSDDDSIFGESSVIFEDIPCPDSRKLLNAGPRKSQSRKAKEMRVKETCSDQEILSSDTSDNESENEHLNSPVSGICLTLSLTVSEDDEECDSSGDWDCVSSPYQSANDQFIFEFDFNTGLSLDSIMGRDTSAPNMSKELRDLNTKWNEIYSTTSNDKRCSGGETSCKKVHFACDDALTTVHFVGNENREGKWYSYALERAHFKKRIEDVEHILAPIFRASHRQKIWEDMCVCG